MNVLFVANTFLPSTAGEVTRVCWDSSCRQWLSLSKWCNYLPVSRIMLICQTLEDYSVERGCPREKFDVLPNGVDLFKFAPQKKDDDIVKRYDLGNKKVILYLGKFQPWEGLPTLVEVFRRVKNEIPDTKLLLVGDGPDKGKIEKAIQTHHLTDDVIITGFVPFDDTPRYYSVCDVFVMVRPKIRKTEYVSPIKPIEAMAMGNVVLSTDLGAMREIIEDGKTGFLTGHSVDAISGKVIKVLNDASLREEISARARAYVERERNWETIAKRLAGIYNSIIQKN